MEEIQVEVTAAWEWQPIPGSQSAVRIRRAIDRAGKPYDASVPCLPKRALRIDKIRLAAIEATLRLYRDPDRLAERLPTLRMMARPLADIQAAVNRLQPALAAAAGPGFAADAIACTSQIGSGSLPSEVIPSAGIALRPSGGRSKGRALMALADALRALDQPVIGRIENDALILDLRCLDNEAAFVRNLAALRPDRKG